MRRVLSVVVVVVALFLLAGTASASTARLEHMRPIAERQFPAAVDDCNGGITIRTGGITSQQDPNGQAWREDRVNGITPCEVRLRESWPTWSRSYLCAIIVHEYGHLALLPHSDDPASVMFPGVSPTSVPACANFSRWLHRERIVSLSLRRIAKAKKRCKQRPTRGRRTACRERKRLRIEHRREALAELHALIGP